MPAPRASDLDLPAALLEALRATRVRAVPDPEPAVLVPLLADLAAEDCGHSWRTWLEKLPAADDHARAARLLERERAARPTTVWAYVAEGEDGPRTLAAATLSDRVGPGFPHEGFPVLARAYVRPSARGNGLYPHIVRHRLARCQARWGRRLRAVHIGASDRPVDQTLNRPDLPLRFVHVGDEALQVAGRTWRVRDYVAFTPAFIATLPPSPPELRAFVRGGAAAVPWGTLRPLLARAVAPGPLQLRDLLDAIGVLP
jgi:GNAT superfamily N-acetyltransferase